MANPTIFDDMPTKRPHFFFLIVGRKYRASADIDLEVDEKDEKARRKITCPGLALWREKGALGQLWDVLGVWRQHARAPVQGRALNGGHYLAEEQPDEVLQELLQFFTKEEQ
jgi:haloacetate dehalogenase